MEIKKSYSNSRFLAFIFALCIHCILINKFRIFIYFIFFCHFFDDTHVYGPISPSLLLNRTSLAIARITFYAIPLLSNKLINAGNFFQKIFNRDKSPIITLFTAFFRFFYIQNVSYRKYKVQSIKFV